MADASSSAVIVDVSACFGSNARRGIGRFTAGLARGLRDIGTNASFVAPPAVLDTAEAAELGLPLLPRDRPTLRGLATGAPCVFHSGSLFELPIADEVIPRAITELGLPVSATWYDAIPFLEPERYQATPYLRHWHAQRAALARSCDHLLAISQYSIETGVSALGLSPAKMSFIGAGVGEEFRPPVDRVAALALVRARFADIVGPYVICVAGDDPRKNAEGLARAFGNLPDALRTRYQLVIAGRIGGDLEATWRAAAVEAGCVSGDVVFVGDVSDDDLIGLYQGAQLSVFPSMNEGFGLPVAEAAATGCPTITSNTSAVPEVLDWAPSTFDPHDVRAISSAIEQGLTDDGFREGLLAAGRRAAQRWTWRAVATHATQVFDVLGVTADGPRARRPRRADRPRLALVGPFGGSPSGIGSYNERLLPHLDELADITCFVEKFWGEAPLGTDGRRMPAGAPGSM